MKKLIVIIMCCFCLSVISWQVNSSLGEIFVKKEISNESIKTNKTLQNINLVSLVPSYSSGRYSFSDVAILNGKTWSVGYDGVNSGILRISTDAGTVWDVREISPDFNKLDAIYFVDDYYGWASGTGDVFRTSDGGENWQKTDLRRYIDFTYLNFFNRNIGYLVGKHNIKGEEASEIWITKNGGETWNKTYENVEWQNPFCVVAVSENVALVILDETKLVRTDNGGKNWRIDDSFNFSTNQLSQDKNGQIWAVGRDGNFFYSVDNGKKWNRPENFPESLRAISWNSIGFIDQQKGFAVGNKGTLAMTMNGGNTWELVDSAAKDDLLKIYANLDIVLIIGSDKLYRLEF